MTYIIIKKRVSLEFLGEDYKDGYLVFTAIPVKDLDALQKQAATLEGDTDVTKASDFLKDQVASRFVEGKISQDGKEVEVTAENLVDFPSDVFIEAWQQMNGKISPKA